MKIFCEIIAVSKFYVLDTDTSIIEQYQQIVASLVTTKIG